MASDHNTEKKKNPGTNEGSDYNNDYEGRNPWNTRDKQQSWLIYIIIAVACVVLAYALSGTAK